jgi:hypothetical protein
MAASVLGKDPRRNDEQNSREVSASESSGGTRGHGDESGKGDEIERKMNSGNLTEGLWNMSEVLFGWMTKE